MIAIPLLIKVVFSRWAVHPNNNNKQQIVILLFARCIVHEEMQKCADG